MFLGWRDTWNPQCHAHRCRGVLMLAWDIPGMARISLDVQGIVKKLGKLGTSWTCLGFLCHRWFGSCLNEPQIHENLEAVYMYIYLYMILHSNTLMCMLTCQTGKDCCHTCTTRDIHVHIHVYATCSCILSGKHGKLKKEDSKLHSL